jgi:hypothetical protein
VTQQSNKEVTQGNDRQRSSAGLASTSGQGVKGLVAEVMAQQAEGSSERHILPAGTGCWVSRLLRHLMYHLHQSGHWQCV